VVQHSSAKPEGYSITEQRSRASSASPASSAVPVRGRSSWMEQRSPSTGMPDSSTRCDQRLFFFLVVEFRLVGIGIVRLVGLVRRKRRPETCVDSLPQVFPYLEERKPFLGDVDCFAGSRI